MISFFIGIIMSGVLIVPEPVRAEPMVLPMPVATTTLFVVKKPVISMEAYVTGLVEATGLSENLKYQMFETIRHESAGFQNIQSKFPSATGPNGREDSWGVCQIHLPSHPTVSREMALDPAFCVPWMAEKFAKGEQSLWTAWRDLFGA